MKLTTNRRAVTPSSSARDAIVHDFARWTALSALRSGSPVKSRRDVYGLLDRAKPAVLFDLSLGAIKTTEFADWHEEKVVEMKDMLPVGWAAKLINVFLKTKVYVGGLGRPGLIHVIHPPIDAGLWNGAAKRLDRHPKILALIRSQTTISGIKTYAAYQKIIEGFRLAARLDKRLLIEVEQWWEGAETP
jgi:hypothetical protein